MFCKKCLLPVLTFFLFGFSLNVSSEEEFAVVDGVNSTSGSVVLDDTFFKLALDVKVFDKNKARTTIYALKTGQKVLFSSLVSGKRAFIKEVYILPASAKRSDYADDHNY